MTKIKYCELYELAEKVEKGERVILEYPVIVNEVPLIGYFRVDDPNPIRVLSFNPLKSGH